MVIGQLPTRPFVQHWQVVGLNSLDVGFTLAPWDRSAVLEVNKDTDLNGNVARERQLLDSRLLIRR